MVILDFPEFSDSKARSYSMGTDHCRSSPTMVCSVFHAFCILRGTLLYFPLILNLTLNVLRNSSWIHGPFSKLLLCDSETKLMCGYLRGGGSIFDILYQK